MYRTSRNLEASIIDFITTQIAESPYAWTNINIEKSFANIYELSMPSICVIADTTTFTPVEVGDNLFRRETLIVIDLFTENDGQRLDLKDTLLAILRDGCPFYEFTITRSGRTSSASKIQNGRIRILKVADAPVKFGVDKEKLDVRDRYRHRLTLTVSTGKAE